MSNKFVGYSIICTYGFAIIMYVAGSYTTELTPFDTTGDFLCIVGFLATIIGAYKLIKSK
jgi:hypothetical protein